MPINQATLLKELRTVRQIVERLEEQIAGPDSEETDPYQRRREVLRTIYWSGNSVAFEALDQLLKSKGTDYHWIAQQVKKGYLSVHPLPGGEKRYSVTSKAVRELDLGGEAGEAGAMAALSEAAFAEDWESEEDAAYDTL
ncbi:MAG: hypothetical protein QME71_03510 [Dehalococcoidia bacterium]|nr:hypothetical protein [Dehalococcoidia bacterium]